MSTCDRGGMWRRACNFQPRYDTVPPNLDTITAPGAYWVIEFIEAMTRKTYVCDVCVRCGRKVTR